MLIAPSRIAPDFGSVVVVPFNPAWQNRKPLKFDHPYIRLNLSKDGKHNIYLQVNRIPQKIGSYPKNGITDKLVTKVAATNRNTPINEQLRLEGGPAILAEWKTTGYFLK